MWPFTATPSSSPSAPSASASQAGPSTAAGQADACPVDHETRAAWLAQNKGASPPHPFVRASGTEAQDDSPKSSPPPPPPQPQPQRAGAVPSNLSTEREVSSIPRHGMASTSASPGQAQSATGDADPSTSSNWVYPSPAQFFAAMARKNHSPDAADMDVVVPIHNAVNERAWAGILEWERLGDPQSQMRCGGPQLVSFKGRPKDLTWRAWGRTMLGYQPPFDRHDWLVDRCGTRVRYIIDFYTGRSSSGTIPRSDHQQGPSLSFFIDVRPAPDSVEGVRMRAKRMWTSWTGGASQAGFEK